MVRKPRSPYCIEMGKTYRGWTILGRKKNIKTWRYTGQCKDGHTCKTLLGRNLLGDNGKIRECNPCSRKTKSYPHESIRLDLVSVLQKDPISIAKLARIIDISRHSLAKFLSKKISSVCDKFLVKIKNFLKKETLP